jgi:hypothetical protein
MSTKKPVQIGDQVYATEGGEVFGAVRYVRPHELVVDIERHGDVVIPAPSVRSVHDGKIIVDVRTLSDEIQRAIRQAHAEEDR